MTIPCTKCFSLKARSRMPELTADDGHDVVTDSNGVVVVAADVG